MDVFAVFLCTDYMIIKIIRIIDKHFILNTHLNDLQIVMLFKVLF